jgi:hypothetical protein
MIDVTAAVISLRPGVEWTMTDDDVEGITWHTPNVEPLTTAEVQAEIARLEQAALDKAEADAQARAAAIAHAKTLGFTDEMIAVMYPGLA